MQGLQFFNVIPSSLLGVTQSLSAPIARYQVSRSYRQEPSKDQAAALASTPSLSRKHTFNVHVWLCYLDVFATPTTYRKREHTLATYRTLR